MKNCIQHALIMLESPQIIPNDLGLDQQLRSQMLQTLEDDRAKADRELISKCLQYHSQNMSRTAEVLAYQEFACIV